MQIELVQYSHQEQPHGFEAHVSLADIKTEEERSHHGRVNVGRVRVFDEESGKFTWFSLSVLRKNGQPVLEAVNIRLKLDETVHVAGEWRKPMRS